MTAEPYRVHSIWRWICFIAWLPWFALTFPWQVGKAYAQVMSAINLSSDEYIDDSRG